MSLISSPSAAACSLNPDRQGVRLGLDFAFEFRLLMPLLSMLCYVELPFCVLVNNQPIRFDASPRYLTLYFSRSLLSRCAYMVSSFVPTKKSSIVMAM